MVADGNSITNRMLAQSCHRTVDAYCADTGDTHEIIAEACGYNAKTWSSQLIEHRPLHAAIPVLIARTLHRFEPVHTFANLCGGLFISAARATRPRNMSALFRASEDVSREVSDVIERVFRVATDGRVDSQERESLRTEIDEAIVTLDALRRVVDELADRDSRADRAGTLKGAQS